MTEPEGKAMQGKGNPLKLNWWYWVLMVGLYALVVFLTAYKDLVLTGIPPNPLYYSIVPVLTILGATTGGYIASRYFKLFIGYKDILFITLAVNFIGQVMEILFKLIYYYLWAYPTVVYAFFVVMPLATIIPAYLYNRWTKIRFAY